MKAKLTSCILLLSFFGFAQKPEKLAPQYFYEGLVCFNNGKLHKADSLFTLSLTYSPDMNTYYEKAVVEKQLGNFAGYCENLHKAAVYGDREIKETYNTNCFTSEFLYLTKDNRKATPTNYCYKLCFEKSKYNGVMEISTYDTTKKLIECYQIDKLDTVYIKFPRAEDSTVFKNVHKPLIGFINKNLKYPEAEKEAGVMGSIFVSVTVNKLGQFVNPEIIHMPQGCLGLANEALRVAKLFPPCKPIVYKGHVVKAKFTFPIHFKLQ